MSSTILYIVQRFCRRKGLPVPSAVVGNNDATVLQMQEILNDIGADLAQNYNFEAVIIEASFTSLAAELQGNLSDSNIAPYGFVRIIDDTIYDRTNSLRVNGPISPQYWQQQEAFSTAGTNAMYRIRGGKLYLKPSPGAGHTIAFEYMSNYIFKGTDGTYKKYITDDNDVIVVPEDLLYFGLKAAWQRDKGLPYLEDEKMYRIMTRKLEGTSGSKRTVDLSTTNPQPQPGIGAPPGNWSL